MRLLITIPILLTLAAALVTTAGASTSSHGGGSPGDGDNVWFLGDEPVEYCIERAPGFPLDAAALARETRLAIDKWRAFFRRYRLDGKTFQDLGGGQAKGLSLDFRPIERCDDPARQIRFLFGVDDPQVLDALRYLDDPYGLALRGSYDHATHRTGGVVWVRAHPSALLVVQHALLHELGHVFGMEHDSVAIMDRRIDKHFRFDGSLREAAIESPVWPFELRAGTTVDFTAVGTRTAIDGRPCEPNRLLGRLAATFGFADVTCHRAVLKVHGDPSAVSTTRVDLTFYEPLTQRSLALTGQFRFHNYLWDDRDAFAPLSGPVLYTKRFCETCGPVGRYFRDYLSKRRWDTPAQGFFEHDGRVFPAAIDRGRGVQLRIFDPAHSEWWSVEPYESLRELRRP